MKKVFLSFLIIITGIKGVLAADERISTGVKNAFRKFPAAKEISWHANQSYSTRAR